MAGHNKWSKVKHKKGAADAKRSKVWTKIIREITVAAKMGGDDPDSNARLRKALDDARTSNISKDTIQRALVRASGDQDSADFEELAYEGYGPAGVAILVECLTDNRNRTFGDVRVAFNKNGGSLGATGSVRFGFKKLGQFVFDKKPEQGKAPSEDMLMELGLEAGIDDVRDEGDVFVVSSQPDNFQAVRDTYEKAGLVPASADVEMVADNPVQIAGDHAKTMLELIDALEDLDDVQKVWTSMDIDDAEMEKLLG